MARFAAEGEEVDENGFQKNEVDSANVYIPKVGVGIKDTLRLSFSNFMWIPRITVEGAYIR